LIFYATGTHLADCDELGACAPGSIRSTSAMFRGEQQAVVAFVAAACIILRLSNGANAPSGLLTASISNPFWVTMGDKQTSFFRFFQLPEKEH
jgi:hypothetical protein